MSDQIEILPEVELYESKELTDENKQIYLPVHAEESLNINTEINLGAIVPISLGKTGSKDPIKRKYKATFVDSNGNIHHQVAEVHAKNGPLTGLTHRVLGAITTLAVNGLKNGTIVPNTDGDMFVSFTITHICHLLGKKTNGGNRNNIVKSIESLRNCDINYKNFICGKKEDNWIQKNILTSIIKDIYYEKKGQKENSYMVQISSSIAVSLVNEGYITTDRETFLSLDDGEMRVHQIIEIKRKQMGDEFIVDLEELAEQFGVRYKQKQSYYVKKYLERYKEKKPEMSFSIKQVSGVKSILFVFKQSKLIDLNSFASDLLDFYEIEDLEALGLSEQKIKGILTRYKSKNFYFESEDTKIDKAEMVIDLMLFQYKFQGTKIAYLDKYFSKLFHEEEITFPTSFKTLKERVRLKEDSQARTKIIDKRKMQEIETERQKKELYQKADVLLDKIKANTPKIYKEMSEKVKVNIAHIDESDHLYEMLFEDEMKKMSICYMEEGLLQ